MKGRVCSQNFKTFRNIYRHKENLITIKFIIFIQLNIIILGIYFPYTKLLYIKINKIIFRDIMIHLFPIFNFLIYKFSIYKNIL